MNKSKREIDRHDVKDCGEKFEKIIKDEKVREVLLMFIRDSILFANKIKPNNWNVNVHKDRYVKEIHFNVGREYCINLYKDYVTVICMKESLKTKIKSLGSLIEIFGHVGRKKVPGKGFDTVPDCLGNVPGSVGGKIEYKDLAKALPYLKEPHQLFMKFSIQKTTLSKGMRKAHSPGFIRYLSDYFGEDISNPVFKIDEKEWEVVREEKAEGVKSLSIEQMEERILESPKKIIQQEVFVKRAVKDRYIAELTKRKAGGICQHCGNPAPFEDRDGKPFLEVHHILPMSEGGEDTIDNVIALCPNCHRKKHYGKSE